VLESSDFERLVGERPLKGVEHLLPALLEGILPGEDLPLARLAEETGLDQAEVDELVALGIVEPERRNGEPWVGFRAVAVAAKWARIRRLGFTSERGYDLSTLERYQAVARELAEVEVAQFLEAFSGALLPEAAAETAAAALKDANDILVQLHVSAVLDTLRRELR